MNIFVLYLWIDVFFYPYCFEKFLFFRIDIAQLCKDRSSRSCSEKKERKKKLRLPSKTDIKIISFEKIEVFISLFLHIR